MTFLHLIPSGGIQLIPGSTDHPPIIDVYGRDLDGNCRVLQFMAHCILLNRCHCSFECVIQILKVNTKVKQFCNQMSWCQDQYIFD